MVTLELLDNRFIELSDELKRIEGSIKENRAMRNWLDAELKKEKQDAIQKQSTGKNDVCNKSKDSKRICKQDKKH